MKIKTNDKYVRRVKYAYMRRLGYSHAEADKMKDWADSIFPSHIFLKNREIK